MSAATGSGGARRPAKLRKRYVNEKYPHVILRFEDGHEIHVAPGVGKSFDAWGGETIKILVLWDATSGERELVESRIAENFQDD